MSRARDHRQTKRQHDTINACGERMNKRWNQRTHARNLTASLSASRLCVSRCRALTAVKKKKNNTRPQSTARDPERRPSGKTAGIRRSEVSHQPVSLHSRGPLSVKERRWGKIWLQPAAFLTQHKRGYLGLCIFIISTKGKQGAKWWIWLWASSTQGLLHLLDPPPAAS